VRVVVRDVGHGLLEVSHNTLALLGLVAITALVLAGGRPEVRQQLEVVTLEWLQGRHEARELASGNVLSAVAEPAAVMRANRAALKGPLGLDDCVHIVSYNYFLTELLGLDDFKTLDAYGQLATRITGNISGPLPNQVGTIDGVPVVVSWLLTDDLAASGLYTGSGAKTGVVTVSRARFWMLTRREVRIESAKDITRGGYDYVATVRELFARAPSTSATDASVAFAYNL
jgi:hypothetical protein